MKVLILANHINYGGISAYILNLCKAIHGKNDFEVLVASRGGDLEKELAGLGVAHIQLPLKTKCEVNPKVFLSFLKLSKIIRELSVDVIHANTRVTQVLSALLSGATGTPYLSTCHGYFKTRLSRRLFPCWGKKVIAISDQVRDHLVSDFGLKKDRIELIYNGVDIEKFHPYAKEEIEAQKKRLRLEPDKKIIGHIGRLSSVKGQEFLILAAEILIQKRHDLQFLIIGGGDREQYLKSLIRQKGLDNVVLMRPFVSDTSLALAVMDVFLMPSLQEGLGISILEAQAQGVPVVASNIGGIPTIIKDGQTGFLFPKGDADAIASNILKCLENSGLRDSIIEKSRIQVRDKFSLSNMADKTRRLYEGLVS